MEHRDRNKKPFGGRKPAGEHRSFGEGRPSRDRKPFGEHKSFGGRRERSEGRPEGEKRSFGEGRPSRDRKPFGEHKSLGDRKPFGERKSYGEHKPFGDRKPLAGRKPFGKPALEKKAAPVADKPQEEVRLNKFIANSGVCSRREADQLIQAGVVTVNGEVVTELGTKVNVLKDEIRFNGERLKGEDKVYIVMNKPKGYVTTTSDPHADKTVMDLIKGVPVRVFPVGRLDKNTTGVLMFTNDGDIAEKLSHPSFDKKKIYQATLDRNLDRSDAEKILKGIELSDGPIKADELEYVDAESHKKIGIEIHSGRNRIVRRIFEELGYEVKALDRVYFAGLTKKGLKRGEWRYLTAGETNILKMGAYL